MSDQDEINAYLKRVPAAEGRKSAAGAIVGRVAKRGAPLLDRILAKVTKTEGGCWVWQGRTTFAGYGRITVSEKGTAREVMTHRAAYEHTIGPVPHGLQLDHLCRNPRCCNPQHLEPVSARENQRRGTSPPAKNAAADACLNGHPLAGDNLYVYKGRRQCKECQRARARKYQRATRAGRAKAAGDR